MSLDHIGLFAISAYATSITMLVRRGGRAGRHSDSAFSGHDLGPAFGGIKAACDSTFEAR